MGKKLPSDILRYMVLKSFEDGPSYGYEVVSSIEDVTDGYWSPSYGTIYPLIKRLEKDDLLRALSSEEVRKEGLENGDRKYFELTDEGKEEITPEGDEEESRERFRELILGYIRIFESKYGRQGLEELLEDI
ncbi:MAG: PadR family transcriptional regulator [Candidatus Nanohaloarchaea archaeon]